MGYVGWTGLSEAETKAKSAHVRALIKACGHVHVGMGMCRAVEYRSVVHVHVHVCVCERR